MQALSTALSFPREIPHTGFEESSSTDAKTVKAFKGFKSDDDFGHLKALKARGTFYPSTVEQICTIVNFARANGISLTCRGKGHSTFGQAQSDGGIVLNLRNLCAVSAPEGNRVTVQAGARWKQVVDATLRHGMTPPVLPDYLGLSVGGILSVGGLGGQALHHGTIADNVLELKVVTMDGNITCCSRETNRELFEASLTTLGQFAIIVEATLRLISAPKTCYVYELCYDNFEMFLAAQRHLLKAKACDYLEGFVNHLKAPFVIEAVGFDKPINFPVEATKSSGEQKAYSEFLHRLKPGITFFKGNGSWQGAHPWINLFLRDDQVQRFVSDWITASDLTQETGRWPILLYPMDRKKLTCPFFQVPDSETVWVFDILRYAGSQERAEELIRRNKNLYTAAKATGATMYPVGSIPLETSDWINHYGDKWAPFQALKAKHDPSYLLGLGQGVFKKQ